MFESFIERAKKQLLKDFKVDHCSGSGECQDCKLLAPERSLSIVVGAASIALSSCRDDLDFYFGTEGNDAVRAIEEHSQMNGLDTKSIKSHRFSASSKRLKAEKNLTRLPA